MVFALINTIFAQETADAAPAQWRVVVDQLRGKFPQLAAMMDGTEHEVLTFMDFPKEHRVKIHSTNVLERLNGEIKRRAVVVGIFPNEAAIRRLVGAILLEQNDEYAIQNRYMSLESLATMSENPPIRLPAAPALA
jgi:putative transposase